VRGEGIGDGGGAGPARNGHQDRLVSLGVATAAAAEHQEEQAGGEQTSQMLHS
jgi:hypothetical protein